MSAQSTHVSWRIFPLLVCLAFQMVMAPGCSGLRRGLAPPWPEALEYQTAHYTIRTNAGPKAGYEIGRLMEKAFKAYGRLLGVKAPALPRLLINAYAGREQYEKIVHRLGLSPDVTTGLYSPVPPAAIHIPYMPGGKHKPDITLLHEGLHQFVDRAMRFPVPLSARKALPPARHKLVSLPLWLNEGLAMYMESAKVLNGRLHVGRVNGDRLRHLKRLIKSGKRPGLKDVLSRPYGGAFGPRDYAVAWGLVYSLRHSSGKTDKPESRKRLSRYIDTCKRAFYDSPEEFLKDFVPGGRLVADFRRRWAKHIGRRSLEAFKEIIVEKGTTLHDSEQDWVGRILRLDAETCPSGFNL